MTPKQRYEQDLKRSGFQHDAAQALAVEALDALHHQLCEFINQPVVRPSRWKKWLGITSPTMTVPQGLYFGEASGEENLSYGYLFDALPTEENARPFPSFYVSCA
ncbi:AFG1/ZapE family ATPase [Vibrio metschnikovii]